MERTSFHIRIRSLTGHASRRYVLHGLAVALGLVGKPVLPLVAGANKKNKRRNKRRRRCASCGPCRRCRKGRCTPKSDGTACGSGTICQGGACVCPDECCGDADCGRGGTCLANASCAVGCDFSGQLDCRGDCLCSPTVEGPFQCFARVEDFCAFPSCTSTADCLQGRACLSFACPPFLEPGGFCVPLCRA
jgi:hypothetical protein